eukprot:CAMPEP_0194145856 /NCGR_PEP_ID=MMETSP0152-20130528/18877_1 /TAXON_ID=1049557 /ORGANISM="Thalassiothrix antarctica, Strain L6-D1" /LENGTH=235 /DNA_ID=CAMNT_0038846215 /DNA_START=36 /DNA_END=743 /DNA_ORIENTATION=+
MNVKSISLHMLAILVLVPATTEAFQPATRNKNKSCIWNPQRRQDSTTEQFPLSLSAFTTATSSPTDNTDVFSDDWKDVALKAFENDKRPIILFDGICNLCSGSVNFALDHDPNETFRFASLQSKTGESLLIQAGRHHKDTSSIIVVTSSDGSHYDRSDAVLYISQGLEGLGFRILANTGYLVPRSIRNVIYQIISENRFRFGSIAPDQCRIDFDGEFDGRFVEDPSQSSLCTPSD